MKILHTVESYLPVRTGMSEVVRQISERLVAVGHDVTVATSRDIRRASEIIDGVRVVEFDLHGNAVNGYQGDPATYQQFLLTSDYDVITNFAAQQWASDLALPILGQIRGKKVFVPTGFSALHVPQYKTYFAEMAAWMREYDMNVFLSDKYRDVAFARSHGIRKQMLIPNGAAPEEFLVRPACDVRQELGIACGAMLVLHVGEFTGVKGHWEAIEIFSRAKLCNAVLLLISGMFDAMQRPADRRKVMNRLIQAWQGRRFNGERDLSVLRAATLKYRVANRWRNNAVIFRSMSRAETVAAFLSADLFLFPSNIECSPIVLFESMAAKTPFLSTDVGNAAEIAAWTGGGDILPTDRDTDGTSHARIDESARLVTRLCHDESNRNAMAENGFAAWQARFSWATIAQQYLDLYTCLLQ